MKWNEVLTIRPMIWLWQSAEFLVLWWMLSALNLAVGWHVGLVLLSMVLLRAVLIGVLVLVIAICIAEYSLSLKQWWRYWFDEFLAFCLLYFWYQAKPRKPLMAVPKVGDRHIIFVHGFFCNDGFWFQLSRLLLQHGYTVSGVEMQPAFASIDDFTHLLANEIERCEAENPQSKITIISFSMGGLACRNLPAEKQKTIRVITLYTPHDGTYLAQITGFFGARNGQQMSVGSEWLSDCHANATCFNKAVGIWSTHDTIVLPAKNGTAPFHSLRLLGRGHLSASIDKKLHRHVLRVLKVFDEGRDSV